MGASMTKDHSVTNPSGYSELKERLRAWSTLNPTDKSSRQAIEALDAITTLEARIAQLEEALR